MNNNPNIYLWTKRGDSSKVNIQDIPEIKYDSKSFSEKISKLSEEAVKNKKKSSMERLKNNPTLKDIVSADNPNKYPIVREFIKDRSRKVYGGIAINSYLPESEKIYGTEDIPDYDFYSPDPWNDAVSLANIFHKKGYKFVEARAGMHKGTYKVLVDLWPVADISYMPKKEYDMVETTVKDGIHFVSPLKLLESMYKEFSEPFANPTRWPKVAIREKLIQKWTQPVENIKCSEDIFTQKILSETQVKLLERCKEYIEKKGLIYSGGVAYNTYMDLADSNKRVSVENYTVLSEKASEDVKDLFTILIKKTDKLNITSHFYPSRELNNTVYRIYLVGKDKNTLLIEIVNLTSCTPFQKIGQKYVVALDYLFYELYDSAVFADTEDDRHNYRCKVKYLSEVQKQYYRKNNIGELDQSPFKRFFTTCKGAFGENIKINILEKMIEREKEKPKTYYRKGYKIKIFKESEKSEECKNKEKHSCSYPCIWGKRGECIDIPKGVYRPGEEDSPEYTGSGRYED
jgi:hypothetical protein